MVIGVIVLILCTLIFALAIALFIICTAIGV